MKKKLKNKISFISEAREIIFSKTLLMPFFAFIISLVILSALLYFGFHEQPEKDASLAVVTTQEAIETELKEITEQGERLAESPGLVEAIQKEDAEAIGLALKPYINDRGLTLFNVVNAEGVVIARTQTKNKIGDNFFINNPIGRRMIESGENHSSIELRATDPRQILFISGHFIYSGEQRIGAMFLAYSTDDSFSKYLRDKYLSPGTEVAFYTNEYGLTSSSIERPIGKELLNRFVRPELDLFQKNYSKRYILLPDGRLFIAQNILLPGAESKTSGILIFTPLTYIFKIFLLGGLLPLLIFFLTLYIILRADKKKEKDHWLVSFIMICVAAVYLVGFAALTFALFNKFLQFKVTPYPLYNSVLRFQPEGGVFDSRFAQRMSVILDSGGEAINAIRLSISYNPKELKVQSVDMDRSICVHFIISEHNSVSGKISMECIIPNPGFKKNAGIVSDLFFKPLEGVKQSSVHFLSDSEVLANDGLATNVLRMAVDTTMRFDEASSVESQQSLLLFSPSHPNPERWYSNKTVSLSWTPRIPAKVLAHEDLHEASLLSLPQIKKVVSKDGEHVFNVQGTNDSGTMISGKITARVDTTPPEELELSASETRIKPGGLVRFSVKARDSMSGLQRVFYLKINDEIFFPIGDQIHVPFPQAGTYTVTARVYDRAGNHRDVSKKIIVKRYQ